MINDDDDYDGNGYGDNDYDDENTLTNEDIMTMTIIDNYDKQ